MPVLASVLLALCAAVRSRAALQLEVLSLRYQLGVLERSRQRVRLTRADRLLWVWISRTWTGWRARLVIVKPETVVAWHRKRDRILREAGLVLDIATLIRAPMEFSAGTGGPYRCAAAFAWASS